MSKKLRKRITKGANKQSGQKSIDNILEMADVVSETVRKATRGKTDGLIETTHKLLRELLEDASKVNLLKRQVVNLALGLPKAERAIFRRLDDADWNELVELARPLVIAFKSTKKSSRRAAIASLKGKFAELVFLKSDSFRKIFREAEDLVDKLNLEKGLKLDKRTVELKRNVRTVEKGLAGELTDGIIVATRPDGDYQILTILEMKSRSNRNDLARRKSRTVELPEELEDNKIFKREGQLEADIERLSELDLSFDGEFVPAGTARFSRRDTAWIGVTPSDVSLSQLQVDRIKPLISNFTQYRQEVSDKSLTKICTKMLELLSEVVD